MFHLLSIVHACAITGIVFLFLFAVVVQLNVGDTFSSIKWC